MTKLLKIACSKWENESRDKRELSVCQDLGMQVLVMAKGEGTGQVENVEGFAVHRFSTRPRGSHMPAMLNRIVSVFTWAFHARRFHADIISGHDLGALTIGWISTWFMPKSCRPKLVYDSHEFEIGRGIGNKRSRFAQFAIQHGESFLMKRCAFSIMVNDSIADEVQRIHKLSKRPVAVRSTSLYWERDEQAALAARHDLCAALGLLPESAFLIMFHGGMIKGRNLEEWLRIFSTIPDVGCVLLGPGEKAFLAQLRTLCEELGIEKRVLFRDAVPYKQLLGYIAAVDLEVFIIKRLSANHYFSLPNKLFESIQAETPIITSNFPAMGSIVNQFGVGVTVDPDDTASIVRAVQRMRQDHAFYAQCKENLKIAKRELCWEKEKTTLEDAYRELMQ